MEEEPLVCFDGWTKDVLGDDYLEKESCLSKTGDDLPSFFLAICHYLYNQPDG